MMMSECVLAGSVYVRRLSRASTAVGPLAAGILLTHAGLLVHLAGVQSPVWHEPAYVYSSLRTVRLGDYSVYRVNPPFPRLLIGSWLAGFSCDVNQGADALREPRGEFEAARRFFDAHSPQAINMIYVARLACIPFSVMGGVICFLWSRKLFGDAASISASLLWTLHPFVLGNASLAMPDVPAAALAAAAGYALSRWSERGTTESAIVSGALIGLAIATKFTCLVLLGLLLIVACWRLLRAADSRARWFVGAHSMLGIAAGILVLNVVYGSSPTFIKLGDYRFVSHRLSGNRATAVSSPVAGNCFLGTWTAELTVPLPAQMLLGLDEQQRDFEVGMSGFLHGVVRPRSGWHEYYVMGLVYKTPLAGLLVAALAAYSLCVGWPSLPRQQLLLLFLPAITFLLVVSSHATINRHLRYVFPALPFLAILFSSVCYKWSMRSPVVKILVGAVVCAYGVEGAGSLPGCLAYFNLAAVAGNAVGRPILGSAADWGQEAHLLVDWYNRNVGCRPIEVIYPLSLSPRVYSVRIDDRTEWDYADVFHMPKPPENVATRRWYAISINELNENAALMTRFGGRRPESVLGKTIVIYSEPSDAPALNAADEGVRCTGD